MQDQLQNQLVNMATSQQPNNENQENLGRTQESSISMSDRTESMYRNNEGFVNIFIIGFIVMS